MHSLHVQNILKTLLTFPLQHDTERAITATTPADIDLLYYTLVADDVLPDGFLKSFRNLEKMVVPALGDESTGARQSDLTPERDKWITVLTTMLRHIATPMGQLLAALPRQYPIVWREAVAQAPSVPGFEQSETIRIDWRITVRLVFLRHCVQIPQHFIRNAKQLPGSRTRPSTWVTKARAPGSGYRWYFSESRSEDVCLNAGCIGRSSFGPNYTTICSCIWCGSWYSHGSYDVQRPPFADTLQTHCRHITDTLQTHHRHIDTLTHRHIDTSTHRHIDTLTH